MPVLADVQKLYAGAFQVPAQTKPLGAMSSTPAGLEGLMEKVNAVLRLEFEPFVAVALSSKVVPNCME
jgi:hypothetical protein